MGPAKSVHICLGLIFGDCVTSTILVLKYGLPTRNKKSPWRVASPCIAILPRVYSMLHVLWQLNQMGSSPWQGSTCINPLVLDSQIWCAQGMRRSGSRFHDNMITFKLTLGSGSLQLPMTCYRRFVQHPSNVARLNSWEMCGNFSSWNDLKFRRRGCALRISGAFDT